MPPVKIITVKESIKELQAMRKKESHTINKRLMMLIEIKKSKGKSLAKRELSKRIGVDANSITNWKKLYQDQGISGILSDGRIGFKPSIFTNTEHKAIETILTNPNNGIRGYKELLQWVKKELNKDMLYITLLNYVKRHFHTKIKVARKSHVKKDKQAVDTFKKTLVSNVLN